jgi:hypothetical protein
MNGSSAFVALKPPLGYGVADAAKWAVAWKRDFSSQVHREMRNSDNTFVLVFNDVSADVGDDPAELTEAIFQAFASSEETKTKERQRLDAMAGAQ